QLAYSQSEQTIVRLKSTYPDMPLLLDLDETLSDFPDLPYFPKNIDLIRWVVHITAGLVYAALGDFDDTINWDAIGAMSPTFAITDIPKRDKQWLYEETTRHQPEYNRLMSLNWYEGWNSGKRQPYPSTRYRFKVHLPTRYDDPIYIWHTFYGISEWFVQFNASEQTYERLYTNLMAGK